MFECMQTASNEEEANRKCLTASEEVCKQADLIRGMRAFFIEG